MKEMKKLRIKLREKVDHINKTEKQNNWSR